MLFEGLLTDALTLKRDCERVAHNSRARNGAVVLCSDSPPNPRALIRHFREVLVVDVGLGHRWSWRVGGSIDRGLLAKILCPCIALVPSILFFLDVIVLDVSTIRVQVIEGK